MPIIQGSVALSDTQIGSIQGTSSLMYFSNVCVPELYFSTVHLNCISQLIICVTKQADADAQVRRPLWPASQLSGRVRTTMRSQQLRTNVHNSTAAVDTIVCKCSQFGIKSGTLEGIVIVRLLLDLVKGKNVTDKGETHPLMSKAKQSVFLYRTEINWKRMIFKMHVLVVQIFRSI